MQQDTFKTERLVLTPLSLEDWEFVKELVNTDGWIRFIGQRNIRSREDAETYIRKIIDNPATSFWVMKSGHQKLGVLSFIQREYLPAPDIGFALLPVHEGKGYAYEAATGLLKLVENEYAAIYATTIPSNTKSIALLNKLGLQFEKEITIEQEKLNVYHMTT